MLILYVSKFLRVLLLRLLDVDVECGWRCNSRVVVNLTHPLHRWNGASLQSYFDAAISIILPFADWHYKLQSSLSTGQVITLSFLNGYIAFRFYQKTLDTVTVAQNTLKESVERKCLEGLFRLSVSC